MAMDQPGHPVEASAASSEREVYLAAIKISNPGDREAFLEQACESRSELRSRVDRLIAVKETKDASNLLQRAVEWSQSPLDHGTFPTVSAEPRTERDAAPSSINVSRHPKIDRYKLLEAVGRGGMGTVYMAQQTEPVRRRVALKIINPGMDSLEVLARFEAERQALALMHHPNIASVFDGGTTETGLPYFVMELVRGIPLTDFCKQKKLSLKDRLNLFLDVCAAVQHAHQKGIIHRDLKPSNILVTMNDDHAVVKVIDFGVAKALNRDLTEKTLFTRFSSMIGTPLYMSPEQAQMSGVDVDTRSDIYSLGVILYELFTGSPPFDRETVSRLGVDGFRRLLQETDPERPSLRVSTLRASCRSTTSDQCQLDVGALASDLQGELDWIVVKALEKDRERRYESAKAFADDIERYLNDEPVAACPPSMGYKLKKQARRHKGLLVTLSVIAATMLVATGMSATFAFQANEALTQTETEKEKAVLAQKQSQENFEAALAAIDKLLEYASSPDLKEVPQSQLIRRKMLEDVLGFYEATAKQLGDNQDLRHQAARTWLMLAQVALSLNDIDRARDAYAKSLKLADELVRQHPDPWPYRATKIAILHDKGYFHLWERHEFEQSRKCFDASLAEVREVRFGRSQGRFVEANDLDLAISEINEMIGLANLARMTGDWQERRRIVMESHRLANEPGFNWKPTRMHIEAEMGKITMKEDPDAAAQHFEKAIQGFGEIVEENPSQQHQRYLFDTLNNGSLFYRNRDQSLAEQYASRAVDIVEQQALQFPESVEYWTRLWDYLNIYITIVEGTLTDQELAVKFRKYDKYLNHQPENFYFFKYRISAQFRLGNYTQALTDMRKALEINPEWAALINQPSPTSIAACLDGDFQKAVLELADEVVSAKPTSSKIRGQRAVLRLAIGHGADAQEDLDFIFVQGDFDSSLGQKIALIALAGDRFEEYRQSCQGMLVHFAGAGDPKVQFRVAWTCALAPNALADYQLAIKLAERAVKSSPDNPLYLGCLGAILFRSGQFQAAERRLREALQKKTAPNARPAYDQYFLAMTLHALGNQAAATEAIRTANRMGKSELSESLPWNGKLTLELLRSEAEALFDQ